MITTFGRVVSRKGVKQRFPELAEKDSLLVDVEFIGPILNRPVKSLAKFSRPLSRSTERLASNYPRNSIVRPRSGIPGRPGGIRL